MVMVIRPFYHQLLRPTESSMPYVLFFHSFHSFIIHFQPGCAVNSSAYLQEHPKLPIYFPYLISPSLSLSLCPTWLTQTVVCYASRRWWWWWCEERVLRGGLCVLVVLSSTYLDLDAGGVIEGDPRGVGEGVGCCEVLVPLHCHVVILDHLTHL